MREPAQAKDTDGKASSESNTEALDHLMEQLNADSSARDAAMAVVQRAASELAFQPLGCRVVQLALQVADQSEMRVLTRGLHGCVRAACDSPHGNYVVQKVVETAPAGLSEFVAEELAGGGAAFARHRYGCRVLCRLLEHAAAGKPVRSLLDEVVAEVQELCRHTFGHHVIEAILEHGLPSQRRRVVAALLMDLARSVRNRNASRVVEKALNFCDKQDQDTLAEALLVGDGTEGGLAELTRNHFGKHVVRALVRKPDWKDAVLRQLQLALPELQTSRSAQRLLSDLGLVARSH